MAKVCVSLPLQQIHLFHTTTAKSRKKSLLRTLGYGSPSADRRSSCSPGSADPGGSKFQALSADERTRRKKGGPTSRSPNLSSPHPPQQQQKQDVDEKVTNKESRLPNLKSPHPPKKQNNQDLGEKVTNKENQYRIIKETHKEGENPKTGGRRRQQRRRR